MTNPQAGQGLASRLEALVSYPHARSRSRGRKKCADLSCTCGSSGAKGCEQNSAILVGKEEVEEEKDGESVSQKVENDTDPEEEEEEESLNDKEAKKLDAEENNNEEDLGNILVAKEMISFHPSMEDLVELISESGVMEEKELAAQLHFVVSYFIRVTSKQAKK